MKSIIILIISIICLVNVTLSQNLYSVTSNVQAPQSNQILNVIDVTTGVTSSLNLDLPYSVISILSVDKPKNTLYLLCTGEMTNLLVQYNLSTKQYVTVATVAGQFNLSPSSQVKFVEKTAFVVLSDNTFNQIDILSLNFATESFEVIQINAPNLLINSPISMGYDYEMNSMVIAYSTNSNQVNLITLNATSPNANTTTTGYTNIQNVGTSVGMIGSSNGNIFVLTDGTIMPGYYSVCEVVLSSDTANCTPLANIGTGPFPFVPFFISGDYKSLITTVVSEYTPTSLSVSAYGINSNFNSVSWNVNNPFTSNNFEYQIYVSFAYY